MCHSVSFFFILLLSMYSSDSLVSGQTINKRNPDPKTRFGLNPSDDSSASYGSFDITEPVIETESGAVRGTVEESAEEFDYLAFKGIPYAEPPVGELRFKDPVPIKKWNGIKDTTRYGPICAQYDIFSGELSDHEDCLYLNVFVGSVEDNNKPKAVMVWIHGGAFIFGSANDMMYGPDYLLRKDIVLVTISYRLGVFGFLNVEDEVAPGNQGLKDQLLALQWVKKNIHNFGGDPNRVTIFGESAGGASVHYLTLSPLSKGLINGAISQSGVVFNPWAQIVSPKENARKLCSSLGRDLKYPKDIVAFLKTVDARKICDVQEKLRRTMGGIPFGPGIDDKSLKPFMPKRPEILAEEGVHVPYLVGHNDREGIFSLLDISKKDAFAMMDERFDMMLAYNSMQILKNYNLTVNQFRRLYYKSEKVSEKNYEKFVDLASELYFIEGIHKFVRMQVKKSTMPTYMYRFTYDSGFSLVKAMITENISGACHSDELTYLFKMRAYDLLNLPHLKKGTREYRLMKQMTEMWTNFAIYGRPTVEITDLIPVHWLPVANTKVFRHLNIDEDLTMQIMPSLEYKYMSARQISSL